MRDRRIARRAAGPAGEAGSSGFRWAPATAVVVLSWLALFPVTSVDAYYHLATGKRILDEGAVPSRGVGSATRGDAAWHDQEWGFQVVAAWVGRTTRDAEGVVVLTRGGTIGLIVLRALCLAATLALLSAHMARLGVDPLSRAVALVLAAFLTFGNLFWAVRPQIFSYLGLAAAAYLLERDRRGDAWAGWTVLAVLAAWSNLHGAFVIGMVLVGTEWIGEWIDVARGGGSRRRGWRLTALVFLSPLAGSVNPHGIHQVLHPLRYALEPEIYRWNVEWSRPDFTRLPLFDLTVVLAVAAFALRGRFRAAEALRSVVFLGLLLSAIRHLPLAALVLVPVLAGGLAETARRRGWRGRWLPTSPIRRGAGRRAVAAVVTVAVVVVLSGAKFVGLLPRFREEPVRPMPEREVRIVARTGIEGNAFNAYRYGGFLMLRLYPREVVFMDGRNDLYGTFRDRVYNRILFNVPGWEDLWRDAAARYDVGWVLLEGGEPLAKTLTADPAWLPVSGPPGSALWVRDTAPNRRRLAAVAGP